MELRHLRYFVAAAELEHFGRAAQRLGIVQPALSKQIRELEEEIGTPLFTRLKRGVRLTAAGRDFCAEAQALLARIPPAVQRARAIAQGRLGQLKIGFVDTVVYHPGWSRIIDRFRRQHPEVRLDLVQHPSLEQGELLRSGAIDAGFVYHQPSTLATLCHHRLLAEKIVLAAPARHPLARQRTVKLTALRDESFVWIPRALSPPYYDLIFSACAARGFAPRIVQEGRSDSAILSLVAAGAGLTFCLASTRYRLPQGVKLIALSDLSPRVHLDLVWRSDHTNPTLPHFLALAQDATLSP